MACPAFLPPHPLRLSPAASTAFARHPHPDPHPHRPRRCRPAALRMAHTLSTVDAIDWLPKPVVVRGPVQHGFGRGSRDLGTPTANLPGHLVKHEPLAARDGVYLGFGVVPTLLDGAVVKVAANLGRNITFDDVTERVLEAYLMATFPRDFYGDEMRLVIVAFLRPEFKFDSIDDLLLHIRNDIAVADGALDLPVAQPFRSHPSLLE